MNTMKDFAAQQLTKRQMNDVKGGMKTSCLLLLDDGSYYELGVINDPDQDKVQGQLQIAYKGIGDVICEPWILN